MFVAVKTDRLIQRVVVLAEQIWRDHYPAIIGEEQVDYMLDEFQSLNSIQAQIRDGLEYYLVSQAGNDVGYFAVQVNEGSLFLSKLYINKSDSGRGLGGQVLDFIQSHWKPERVRLTVNRENADSIRFYENRGFSKTGEVVQDIGKGFVMDDYAMQWSP